MRRSGPPGKICEFSDRTRRDSFYRQFYQVSGLYFETRRRAGQAQVPFPSPEAPILAEPFPCKDSAKIQMAPTAARLYALEPHAMWLPRRATAPGASTSTLNIDSISASSRAAGTSRIPRRIAIPASANAIPVRIAQKFPPKGIHFGTIGATCRAPVKCARPKRMEETPKIQRTTRGALKSHADPRVACEA